MLPFSTNINKYNMCLIKSDENFCRCETNHTLSIIPLQALMNQICNNNHANNYKNPATLL